MDLPTKKLEDYNEIFADIINVSLFEGRQVILPDELETARTISQYKADTSELHEEERDSAKYWKRGTLRISTLGIENQSKYYRFMPVRVIGYDGAAYREQLLVKDVDRVWPVVTVVLNFSENRWRKNRSLLECLDIPEEIRPFVNDYRIHVVNVAWLTDEQLRQFRSDFRIVAEYFVCRRKKRDYQPPDRIPEHVDEIMKMMSAITHDQRFVESWNEVVRTQKGRKEDGKMGEKWLDKIEARGEARGEQRGITKGKIIAYYEEGRSIETIAEKVQTSIEYVKQVLGLEPAKSDS
jgi:hypothetical protein